MKKLVYVVAILTTLFFIAACGNKSSENGISSEDVEQQLVTFAEAEAILNGIYKDNMLYINEEEIKAKLEPKGYIVVEDDEFRNYYYCMKNCELKKGREDRTEISFTKINQDSLASALCFMDCGAGGVVTALYLFSDDVYNVFIEQAKQCGFREDTIKKHSYGDLYKGRFGLQLDKSQKRFEIRDMTYMPEESQNFAPSLSETLTCSNYLNLLDYIDDEKYAEKCGLKKIYKDVDNGDIEYVYGIDVEKGEKGGGIGYNVLSKSDHACYVRYFKFGFSLIADLYFKDKKDADNFFENAKNYGFKDTGYGTFNLPKAKIPRNNKKNPFELEELYMDKKVRLEDGWYVIDINTGDFGD